MRTTLDIADDVLLAAKDVARREKRSAGAVVTEWARATLLGHGSSGLNTPAAAAKNPLAKFGIHPQPRRGGVVTNDLINKLRDQEGV